MKLLINILSLFISVNLFASSMLDSSYNSINYSYTLSFGDIEGSGTSTTFSIKPFDQNFIFQYSLSKSDIDEVLGLALDIDGDGDSFQLGYLIGDDNSHFIPFISTGSLEYSIPGIGNEADVTTYGFLCRVLTSESSVLSFGLAHSETDDVSIPGSAPIYIKSEATTLTLNLDYHLSEKFFMRYGLATDSDTVTFSLGGALKF